MKRIIWVLFMTVFCLASCSKKDENNSVSNGLLQTLQNENPTLSISYLYEGVVEFMPQAPKAGIAFYPGGDVEYTAYAPLMVELAKRGYVCLLMRMPKNLALLDTKAGVRLRKQYKEIPHFYLAGHSLGGTSAAIALASNLDNFEGLILLAAYSTKDLSETGKTVLSIYGSEDGVLKLEKYNKYKSNLPGNYHELIVQGGNHSGFACNGLLNGDNCAAITMTEQIAQTADFIDLFAK